MSTKFVALDVETANPSFATICQIGIVTFVDGSVIESWQRLVNPEDYFAALHTLKHGIDAAKTKNAPTFLQLTGEIQARLSQQVVVHHTPFDRVSVDQACRRYDLPVISCRWLDTAKVVRRTWSELAVRGYRLANVAERLNIEFEHHVAQEDARATGEVLLHAIAETGLSLDDWMIRIEQPISPRKSQPKITREGNPDGLLAGEVLVFTGALSMPRRQAADLAAEMGCDVKSSVGKSTTLLVVGDQDIRKLAGHEKSSKHRKAEQLIADGYPIRIVGESDFGRLVELAGST